MRKEKREKNEREKKIVTNTVRFSRKSRRSNDPRIFIIYANCSKSAECMLDNSESFAQWKFTRDTLCHPLNGRLARLSIWQTDVNLNQRKNVMHLPKLVGTSVYFESGVRHVLFIQLSRVTMQRPYRENTKFRFETIHRANNRLTSMKKKIYIPSNEDSVFVRYQGEIDTFPAVETNISNKAIDILEVGQSD